jgi:predicted Zn-dependent protease
VAIGPTNVETIRELATLYMQANRFQDAATILRRAASHRPDDLAVQQELGHALQRNGDPDGAAQVYEGILAAAPQAIVTRGLLAEVRIAQGRFDEAIGLFQAGLARDANVPLLHRGLASALERAGRDTEAAAEYREYARLAPGAADAQELAARAAALEARAASTS